MRYVSAYLLASLGGNKNPTVDDISKILGSVGIEVDADKAKKVVSELSGKDIAEIIKKGSEKLASVPSGGAAAAAAPAAAAGGAPAPAGGKAEAKKEEKKAQSEESEDDDMGFGLFD